MSQTSSKQPATAVKSPPAKRQKPHQRPYGFACSNCRRKKAKCNGEYPSCDKCINSKDLCSYDKGPSVAHALSLQSQLKAYQTSFKRLRYATTTEERLSLLSELLAKQQQQTPDTPPDDSVAELPVLPAFDHNGTVSGPEVPRDRDEHPEETSIGVDGSVCFYGETSLYHIEPQGDGNDAQLATETSLFTQDGATTGNTLPSTCTPYTSPAYFSGLETTVASIRAEIPNEAFDDLLAAYWCLPHHLHLVLCKRLFLRDLETAGPYMTPFLLCSVLTQAARYSNHPSAAHLGNHFAARALQVLAQDIDRGSSIPTIQGLLILSSRDVACGRTAQGWLYSGMAFRMMRDLGLHVRNDKLGYLARQFSEEDLAMRKQVFWSCYTWDKTMSLCLGRAPIIHDTIDLPTSENLLDGHTADDELWVPIASQNDALTSFRAQKALSSDRFAAYCELTTIINDVLDVLYSRPHSGRNVQLAGYLASAMHRLEEWASKIPSELCVQASSRVCPPLHILLLNLVYRATTILLCRPYRNNSLRARSACTEAARMIDILFTLHVRRFGFKYITYLQTYTMFVASTINVLDFRENQPKPDSSGDQTGALNSVLAQEASARLDFGLEVLRQAKSTPSGGRCAAIISRLLLTKTTKREKSTASKSDNQHTGNHEATATSSNPAVGPSMLQDRPATTASGGFRHLRTGQAPTLPRRKSTTQASGVANAESSSEMIGGFTFQHPSNDAALPLAQNQYLQFTSLDYAHTNGDAGLSRESFVPLRDVNNAGAIETPLRWLPENMQDDGSWMLMMDGDPSYAFTADYAP